MVAFFYWWTDRKPLMDALKRYVSQLKNIRTPMVVWESWKKDRWAV